MLSCILTIEEDKSSIIDTCHLKKEAIWLVVAFVNLIDNIETKVI